ncbi:MAG: hypothetical protein NT126_13075 [Bacteroidetes bacterium]|nr:hypothetical protein [Bacteroidota bacterium]
MKIKPETVALGKFYLMERISRFRHFENFHIVLWLVKDMCWCTLSRTMGMIMITPTILLAIYITWIHRAVKTELLHNLAVVFWICANSVWMIGEFYYEDSTRKYALIFFIAGMVTAGYYYVTEVILKRMLK